MKNYFIALLIVVILVLAGVIFFGSKPKTAKVSATAVTSHAAAPAAPNEKKTAKGNLPTLVVLYHKGERDSMRAVSVADQIERAEENLAVVDIYDTLDDPQIAVLYGVKSVPAFVILTPSGQILEKYEGCLDRNSVARLIESAK